MLAHGQNTGHSTFWTPLGHCFDHHPHHVLPHSKMTIPSLLIKEGIGIVSSSTLSMSPGLEIWHNRPSQARQHWHKTLMAIAIAWSLSPACNQTSLSKHHWPPYKCQRNRGPKVWFMCGMVARRKGRSKVIAWVVADATTKDTHHHHRSDYPSLLQQNLCPTLWQSIHFLLLQWST